MFKYFSDYLMLIASLIGTYMTLCEFIPKYFGAGKLNEQGKYGIIFLGILCFWFLIQYLFLKRNYRKKVRYVSFFKELNLGFSFLHSLDHNAENTDSKKLTESLENICNHVSEAFKEAKGHKIGVCIKLIVAGGNDKAQVITLCRDNNSKLNDRPSKEDDIIKHFIEGNSDFNDLYKNIEKREERQFYLNNNLVYTFDYSNSRLSSYENWPPKNNYIFNPLLRLFLWPLSYRSTVVVPIVPYRKSNHSRSKLRGYLCIDSPHYYVFNKQYDVEILMGVSDAIYTKIDTLHKNIINEQ